MEINAKKNWPIILGILIPVVMILLIVGSIYLPSAFTKKPQYNFLFVLRGNPYYAYPAVPPGTPNQVPFQDITYSVENGKLVQNSVTYYYYKGDKPPVNSKLYFYDTSSSQSREISFEEASKFSLNTNSTAPDGYEIVPGNRGGGVFPFFYDSGTDYNSHYLKKGLTSIKVNLPAPNLGPYYSDNNFQLLGWIIN